MKAIKRAIILCWAMLIVCFVIKLFGGNWFEIICNNEHFVYICDFIDAHLWVQDILALITYLPSTMLIMLASASLTRPSAKQVLVLLACVGAAWTLQYVSLILKMIAEIAVYLAMPTVLHVIARREVCAKTVIKENWYKGIFGILFCCAFQLLSISVKNIGNLFVTNNTLVALILMIDYYIMVILYYLYVKLKKGDCKNG